MGYQETKQALQALPLYAADYQEQEIRLIPERLIQNGCVEAAASVYYAQKRALLLLTRRRLRVLYAKDQPSTVLDLPLSDIVDVFPCSWYGTGNITCHTPTNSYHFALMSPLIYEPLAKRIEALAHLGHNAQNRGANDESD